MWVLINKLLVDRKIEWRRRRRRDREVKPDFRQLEVNLVYQVAKLFVIFRVFVIRAMTFTIPFDHSKKATCNYHVKRHGARERLSATDVLAFVQNILIKGIGLHLAHQVGNRRINVPVAIPERIRKLLFHLVDCFVALREEFGILVQLVLVGANVYHPCEVTHLFRLVIWVFAISKKLGFLRH